MNHELKAEAAETYARQYDEAFKGYKRSRKVLSDKMDQLRKDMDSLDATYEAELNELMGNYEDMVERIKAFG